MDGLYGKEEMLAKQAIVDDLQGQLLKIDDLITYHDCKLSPEDGCECGELWQQYASVCRKLYKITENKNWLKMSWMADPDISKNED